ncbi:MAG: hypothetical protein EON86_08325 [Brevundimonas sp.]|nr:MAG: hypothetical protein EON86_08325 [Brevundimonas sp.]
MPDQIGGEASPFTPAFVVHQVSAPLLRLSAEDDRLELQPVSCESGDCGADYVIEVSIRAQTLAGYEVRWSLRAGDHRDDGMIVRDATHIRSFGAHLPYNQSGLLQTAVGADLDTIGQNMVRLAGASISGET